MNDDYLWDKSGEPDPEIEELEQVLESLRYRRPVGGLPLPQRAPVNQRRTFRPALAVAAAALFMMIATGIWFSLGLRGQRESAGIAAISIQAGSARDWLNPESFASLPAPGSVVAVKQNGEQITAKDASNNDRPRRSLEFRRRQSPDFQTATNATIKANRRERISNDEGIAAKEQLIKALHLASSKLNLVQKKVQDSKIIGPES